MGKVVKFTGSKLLGEELRRMRGGRTLDDVVELGKSKLVPSGFRYVGKGTLSDIENGKVLPNLESVFALSVLYQVPASRFVSLLLEESIAKDVNPPSPEELHAAYTRAVGGQEWTTALALAVHGVRTAIDRTEELRWRLNRAVSMEQLGMRTDAIAEISACLESPALAHDSKYKVHRELGRMYMSAGYLQLAEMHLDAAKRLMPAAAPSEIKLLVHHSRVRLLSLLAEDANAARRSELADEADAAVREARLLVTSPRERLAWELSGANLMRLRGKVRDAKRLALEVMARARETGHVDREIEALQLVAATEAENVTSAQKHLLKAAELATNSGLLDLAFASWVSLVALAENAEQREVYIRKCQKLYPLVAGQPLVLRRYEKLLAERQ